MTDPTPPPERPLSENSRARIRAELVSHAQQNRSPSRRWVVPVAAAAAVALVAGMAYWSTSPGSSESDGLPATGGGSSSPTAGPTVDPTVLPSNEGTATPTPPGPDETIDAGAAVDEVHDPREAGAGTCEQELENVLKGATLALQVDDHSSFYVKDERFVLCDVRDGTTTITHPLPLQPQEELATYRVLSMYPPARDGFRTVRVAGGIVPPGARDVFDVTYTFPDGHVQHATTASDAEGRSWWLMAYSYDEGGGSELDKPPIEVTVSYSGRQEHYSLQYGVDTCAQANHGC